MFTTTQIGWIVGDEGTILRSVDGGEHFLGIKPPAASENVTSISCEPNAPQNCFVATEVDRVLGGAKLYKTTNALDPPAAVSWTDITHTLYSRGGLAPGQASPSEPSRLKDVAVVNATIAYVAGPNRLYATWNAGANWTELPSGYVPTDFRRLNVFPDNTGYVYGGTEGSAFLGYLGGYLGHATYQSQNLVSLPAGAKIVGINVTTIHSSPSSGKVNVFVSANGGQDWASTAEIATPLVDFKPDATSDSAELSIASRLRVAFLDDETWRGNDARVRVDFETPPDSPQGTGTVNWINLTITYRDSAGSPVNATPINVTIDLKTDAKIDAAKTNAVWNKTIGQLHQPLFQKYWTRNVSGYVHDIQTGYDVTGDGRAEVWVATGDLLAENSPEYNTYAAGNPDFVAGKDNRIYLLDGATGAVIRNTTSFVGAVKHLRLSDKNGDGWPDVVFGVTWDGVDASGAVYAFDARNLTGMVGDGQIDTIVNHEPTDGEQSVADGVPGVVVGMRMSSDPNRPASGAVKRFQPTSPKWPWTLFADERGEYLIGKTIPSTWFFGPYVAEVRVEWEETVDVQQTEGLAPTKILQSARFYDYFIVEPPSALRPPSAVYDVHLVAWFDDWR